MVRKLICPNCGSPNLREQEKMLCANPVTAYLNRDGLPKLTERDGAYVRFDECCEATGVVDCADCGFETTITGLKTERRFAHQGEDIMVVDEDSHRGAEIRFQAVCYARQGGYECGWAGAWHFADQFVDQALRLNEPDAGHAVRRPGGEVDPSQLAYEAAEEDGKHHLIDEGVADDDTDQVAEARDLGAGDGAAHDAETVGAAAGDSPIRS